MQDDSTRGQIRLKKEVHNETCRNRKATLKSAKLTCFFWEGGASGKKEMEISLHNLNLHPPVASNAHYS